VGQAPEQYEYVMNRLLPLLAVPVFLIAGCAAGTNTNSAPSPTPTTRGTASAGQGGGSATTTTSGTPAAGNTGTGNQSGDGSVVSSPPRCHTADLSVRMGAGGAAAGTFHTNLDFTNKSHHTCTLYGYPGVSWVTGNKGTQVNDPFQRVSGTRKTIKLAPGGTAHAILITHDALNFPASTCKPVSVRGYRIYPPDETAAVFVSAPQTQCSAKSVNLGQVEPIAAGAGQAGD
jgi:Protein of unknown function (DUF4232)